MNYFKNNSGDVFAYDDEQVAAGLAGDLIEMTPEQVDAHLRPAPTAEQLRAQWKAERAALVEAITVTVDGMVFDGDEVSQGRMSRAAVSMTDNETLVWVLADNTPAEVTRAQLLSALRLAGVAQAAVWVAPQ